MASIYATAYVTLAAGTSKDNEGVLSIVDDQYTVPNIVEVDMEGMTYRIQAWRNISHTDQKGHVGGGTQPLMRRGWFVFHSVYGRHEIPLMMSSRTYQERLSPRRYLLSGREEILWKCMEDIACTCSSVERSFNVRSADLPHFRRRYPPVKALVTRHSLHFAKDWRRVMEYYSGRELTFKYDRLPALAGLDSFFHVKSRCTSTLR